METYGQKLKKELTQDIRVFMDKHKGQPILTSEMVSLISIEFGLSRGKSRDYLESILDSRRVEGRNE